ncbi:MAG: response regulator [Candidatus Delongbacteria bacterium]|nr:response regulator [Candidatus Delongbacteria bacterium]
MIQPIRTKLIYKLFSIFFIAIILPVGIATILIYGHIKSQYFEKVESSLDQGEKYVLANFSNELKLLKASLLKIKNDSKLIDLLKHDLEKKDLIEISLYRAMSDNDLDFIYIYDKNKRILYQTGKFIQVNEELLANENKTPEISYFNSKFITDVNIYLEVNNKKNENITFVFGKILSEQMLDDLSNIMELDFILFKKSNSRSLNVFSTLFDNYGQNFKAGAIRIKNINNFVQMRSLDISEQKYHALTFSLPFFDQEYTGMILAQENIVYRGNVKLYLTLFFLGLAFFVLLSVMFIRIKMIKPITQLLESIHATTYQVENERPIEKIVVNTSDEIFLLAEAYNMMASNLGQSFSRIKYLQNYLLNIIESMPSSLIALDKEGKITQWNKAAVEFTGISQIEAKGETIWDLLPNLGIDKYDLIFLANEKDHKEYYKESIWSGEKRNLNVHLFPLIANGVQGNVIRIDDVTDIKRKEEQLIQAQKMETVGTLAGGIAHDFNNILSGIVGVISILTYKLDKSEEIPKDLLKEYLDIMEESGNRAGDIVQRLLTLSKKQNTNKEPVNLTKIISHVEQICLNSFDKRIEIKKIGTNNNTFIFADFTQIEQVLLNLSINASHAMTIMRSKNEKQGGTLTFEINENVDFEEISKFIDIKEDQKFIKIIVKDTGVGMDWNIIKQIYEPFFSTKNLDSGTGLGLTMAYNIVTQFKGIIDVDSTPQIGTEFKVYFPKYDASLNTAILEDEICLKKGSGTVLVIDDELVLRELSTSMLKQCGYNIITASDGVEGIQIYKEKYSEISAIILDMVMPKINGKETFIELKKINPDVKVLLASGFTRDDRVEEVIELGVKDFIQKPFTIFELSSMVYKITTGE